MAYRDTILAEPGLLSYWQCAEASPSNGSPCADQKGANNGAYNGSPLAGEQTPPGSNMAGGVLFPDPAGGSSGFISAGNNASLQINKPFTLEAWFKLGNNGVNSYALISHQTASYYFRVVTTGGNLRLEFLKSQTASILQSTTNLAQGVWYHAAVTLDAAGNVIIYLNGAQDKTGTTALTFTFSAGLNLGADINTEKFGGVLGNLAIYNAALSPAAIANHYAARSLLSPPRPGMSDSMSPIAGGFINA